jgi:hypothetical protein
MILAATRIMEVSKNYSAISMGTARPTKFNKTPRTSNRPEMRDLIVSVIGEHHFHALSAHMNI